MRKILLADDQEELRLLLQATLEEGEYELLEAETGPEALAVAKSAKPALLVMDWMMPGMSGLDVVKALRQDPETSAMPVILLTARSQATDRRLGLEAGASVYLSKPFSPIELLAQVERLLGPDGVPQQGAPGQNL